MRCRLAFLLGATLLSAQPLSPNYDLTQVTPFTKHFAAFLRAYWHCPDTVPLYPADCRPEVGVVDLVELRASREEAKRLFDLR